MAMPTTIDIDEIKRIVGFKTDKHDEYLTTMIPLLLEYVTAYCNNDFAKKGEVVVPGGAKIFIAKACEYNMQSAGLKGRTMGTVSYSYELEFPESIIRFLRPYRRLKFHASR